MEECTAALAKEPDSAPILDSKGFVLLRLARFDEAITLFDKALAGNGQMAESLYGRAIAWQRLGNQDKAQGDKTAALKIDPAVQKRFEGYGVMFDSAASPKS